MNSSDETNGSRGMNGFLEATRICAAAWFLALIQKKICGFQYDEHYIGNAEERAAKNHADDGN